MKLEFTTYQLKEESKEYERIVKGGEFGTGTNKDNQFIVVKFQKEMAYVHQVKKEGIALIPGLNLVEQAYVVPKDTLELYGKGYGTTISEFDIELEYLTLKIVDEIKKINKR